MKVGVYVGEKEIDKVRICEDYEEAWEHVYEELDFELLVDGMKVYYGGKVILEAYKPDFNTDGLDYEDIKEKLHEELTQWKGIIYLVDL